MRLNGLKQPGDSKAAINSTKDQTSTLLLSTYRHKFHCNNKHLRLNLLVRNIPYSGFLSREKTSANCLKIDFHGENLREFAVTQCTPRPTNAVSNCLKIDFCGETFANRHRKRKSFIPEKKPTVRVILLFKIK